MTRSEFMKALPLGSPYSTKLADELVDSGYVNGYAELRRQLNQNMAADVDGPLKGTTVREAFKRAARLDDAARTEWVKEMEAR